MENIRRAFCEDFPLRSVDADYFDLSSHHRDGHKVIHGKINRLSRTSGEKESSSPQAGSIAGRPPAPAAQPQTLSPSPRLAGYRFPLKELRRETRQTWLPVTDFFAVVLFTKLAS